MFTTNVEKSAEHTPVWCLTDELKEISSVEAGILPELVSIFLNDSASRLQTLARACVSLDFKTVRAQAHSLKGSAVQMGAVGLACLCASLEICEKPPRDTSEPMMHSINLEFALVRKAMEDYLVDAESALLTAGPH